MGEILPTFNCRFPHLNVPTGQDSFGTGCSVPVATVWRVGVAGTLPGGAEGDGDGLKGSDHKEQEQSVFVAVCAASITSHHQPSQPRYSADIKW